MELPSEAISQYQALNQQHYQRSLSDTQATDEILRLLRLAQYSQQLEE